MARHKNQKYDDHFKTQVVRLAQELGPGRAASQLGVTLAILHYWRKVHQVKKISKEEQARLDQKELRRLRKETVEQKQVIPILKIAAAFFSNDQQK